MITASERFFQRAMVSKFKRNHLLYLLVLLLVNGCSNLNCTRLETLLGGDVNLVSLGEDIADTLIVNSFPPLIPHSPGQPVLIVSLVNEDDLNASSSLGRTLQNHIASRFVHEGYSVKEIKLRDTLLIRPRDGEFMLSRYLKEISAKEKAQAIVVGTYSIANRVMYLSLRLVTPGDRTIRSTWDRRLCLDQNSLKMLGLKYQEEDEVKPPRKSLLNELLF
jgi:hypothetical protein